MTKTTLRNRLWRASLLLVCAGLLAVRCTPPGPSPNEATIPAEAWSQDVDAGGYLDGAPIGGFGAGTITWQFDGAFYWNRLDVGSDFRVTDDSCAFYAYQKPAGRDSTFSRLDAGGLGSGQATYYALFPRSWVDYHGSAFPCKMTVTQFSPIIPHDYQRTSYPVGVYRWEISNPTGAVCDAAVMLTWHNGLDGSHAEAMAAGSDAGLVLRRRGSGEATSEWQVEFALASRNAAGVTVSVSSGALGDLEADFSADGLLDGSVGAHTTGGVAFKARVEPGQRVAVPIVLAWDVPIARAGGGSEWYREYTRHFGRSGLNAWSIAQEALADHATWERSIDAWQDTILDDPAYPAWLKTALFNELTYYFTGGAYWEAGAASGQADDPDEDMFSHLETYLYPFYGTSDVRFYGSWPLALLWPELDKQAIRQFADSVYHTRSDRPPALGTTAHDFGTHHNVFQRWNAYDYRDSTEWKDLNAKLVLMVYRTWDLTGRSDAAFLDYTWIPVQVAMDKVKSQDTDGDGLPNNDGADQTYDTLGLYGDSAYCGSLFLAACRAAKEIALAVGDAAKADLYQSWYDLAQPNFEAQLWNGSYYNIDTESSDPSRIMSDQLAGQWYARATGLADVVPADHAVSALTTIYDFNYRRFDGGAHGVVNVMTPGGAVDGSDQGGEVWVGTSWGVVAAMVQHGLVDEAEAIGYSLYDTIYNTHEQYFRTPEAWQSGVSHVRANYYMRANAVWAVKHAYDLYGGEP